MINKTRKKKIENIIRRELGEYLIKYPVHPFFVKTTITDVDVNLDLSTAKIFFSVFDEFNHKDVKRVLDNNCAFLRKMLANNLNLRITPRLTFFFDESLNKAQKLTKLIENTN